MPKRNIARMENWYAVWVELNARADAEGWTVKQLAEASGLSTTKLAAMSEGEPLKRRDKIAALIKGMGWTRDQLDEILTRTEPTPPPGRAGSESTAEDPAAGIEGKLTELADAADAMTDSLKTIQENQTEMLDLLRRLAQAPAASRPEGGARTPTVAPKGRRGRQGPTNRRAPVAGE